MDKSKTAKQNQLHTSFITDTQPLLIKGIKDDLGKKIDTLSKIKGGLDEAARIQPCPGCKHDIEQLSKFMEGKIESIKTGASVNNSAKKALKEVDSINELTDMAIVIAKIIKPFTRVSKVPEVYVKVLNDDLEANRKVKIILLETNEMIKELKDTDKELCLASDIMDSFIGAVDFKLSIDPVTFYLFDRTIKLGYKTHLLRATSKAIVGVKGIINPSRYR